MTRTTLLLLALLIIGCGDTHNYYTASAGGAGAAGGGGAGAASAATAGGSDGGSAGEGGGVSAATSAAGGSGGGGGGDGGAGGMAPMCPPAPCPLPSDADLVINCDPACGAVSPQCAQACVSSIPIPVGLTVIRTPPITAQLPECEALCGLGGAMWAMAFEGPGNQPGCIRAEGPAGGLIGTTSADPPLMCHNNAPYCTATGQDNTPPVRPFISVHPEALTNEPVPDGGALFRVEIAAAPCSPQQMPCPAGCNGTGG